MNYKNIILSATILIVNISNNTIAMEKTNRSRARAAYVQLSADKITHYTGPEIKYFNEYQGKEVVINKELQYEPFTERCGDNNWNSQPIRNKQTHLIYFPVHRCDPLPLKKIDNSKIRWFFTSAIEGNVPRTGEAIEIINPSITHVCAVRGIASNNNRVHIYFGYNTSNPVITNGNKTYEGTILLLQHKDTKHVDRVEAYSSEDIKLLQRRISTNGLTKETSININDDLYTLKNSPQILQQIDTNNFCRQHEGAHFTTGCLVSSLCYWTKTENKLKSIQYRGSK